MAGEYAMLALAGVEIISFFLGYFWLKKGVLLSACLLGIGVATAIAIDENNNWTWIEMALVWIGLVAALLIPSAIGWAIGRYER